MDQPLGMLRMDYSYDFPDAVGIIPHASWRGTYEIASFTTPDCKQVFLPYAGMVFQDSTGKLAFPASVTNEQGIEQDTTQQRCVEIDFPGQVSGDVPPAAAPDAVECAQLGRPSQGPQMPQQRANSWAHL